MKTNRKTNKLDNRQLEMLNNIPEKYRKTFEKLYKNESIRSTAIKSKCRECCNFVQSEYMDCNITTCALFHFRAGKTKKNSKNS